MNKETITSVEYLFLCHYFLLREFVITRIFYPSNQFTSHYPVIVFRYEIVIKFQRKKCYDEGFAMKSQRSNRHLQKETNKEIKTIIGGNSKR